MMEADFPDTRLTFLILQDPTLFGTSDKLAAYERPLVEATLGRLVEEGYVEIRGGAGEVHPDTGIRRDVGRLTPKGRELFGRLQHRWRE
jgi:DNA-binding MarR family transcriptional regulator